MEDASISVLVSGYDSKVVLHTNIDYTLFMKPLVPMSENSLHECSRFDIVNPHA